MACSTKGIYFKEGLVYRMNVHRTMEVVGCLNSFHYVVFS